MHLVIELPAGLIEEELEPGLARERELTSRDLSVGSNHTAHAKN